MSSLIDYRFIVPEILALGGAMKKLVGYLTREVEQLLRDMQECKEDIPASATSKRKTYP